MRALSRFTFTFLAGIVLLASPALAQTTPVFSDEIILYRGERFMPFIDGPVEEYSESSAEFTRQQLRLVGQMRENISSVASVIKSCPLFHPPQGFKLVIRSNTLPPVDFPRNESLSGILRLELYVTLVCNEKPCYDKTTDATLTLTFNNPARLAGTHIMDDIWIQPRKVSDFQGFPVYRFPQAKTEVTVVSSANVPLYLPVTREDFIMTLIRHFSEFISDDERYAAMPGSKETLLSATRADSLLRRAEFEEAYNRMNRFDPLLARKLKDNYEEAERRLAKGQTDSSAVFSMSQFLTMQVNVWQEGIRKLRAELNAMNPSERRSQAHWSESEMMNTSGLTPPGHPGSNPVARINPAIMDNSRNDADIQLVTVEWGVDATPYENFRRGRSLVYNKLHELSRCTESWNQVFSLIKDDVSE
jgi:hypothetical protein